MVNGLFGGHALRGTQFFSIIEHDDAVAHDDAHQGNDAQDAGHAEVHTLYQHTRGCPEEAEQQAGEHQQGDAYLAEVGEKDEEDDGCGQCKALHNHRHFVIVGLLFTSVADADSGRESDVFH